MYMKQLKSMVPETNITWSSMKEQAMGQVKVIASLNLAPEIKLEWLDSNNFGP